MSDEIKNENVDGKQADAPKEDIRFKAMTSEIGRLKIEALAASAGAVDVAKVYEAVWKYAKPEIDATGTVKIAMIDPETGEKLRTASGEDMTPGGFIQQLKADPDHGNLFKDGASKPSAKETGGLTTEQNPWHRNSIHLGEQARLLKSDPAYAARLQAAARGTLADNPFSKEKFNLTKQSQILRDDPALAQRMRAEITPKENHWLKPQENLTKQVLLIRSNPSLAAKLKAEAKLENGPDRPKLYLTTFPVTFGRRA